MTQKTSPAERYRTARLLASGAIKLEASEQPNDRLDVLQQKFAALLTEGEAEPSA